MSSSPHNPPTPSRAQSALKLGLAAMAIAGVVALLMSGALDGIDGDAIKQWIKQAGWWGPALFVLALGLLQPLHISIYVFLFTAAAVWEPWWAILYTWMGIQVAGGWSFVVSRYLARDFFMARIPQKARPHLERIAQNGLKAMIWSRFALYTTPAMQWAYGLTPIHGRDFVIGTAVGTLPWTAISVIGGRALIDWWQGLDDHTRGRLGLVGAGGAVLLLGALGLWMWWRRRITDRSSSDPL